MPTVGSGITLQPGYRAPSGNGIGDTAGSYGGFCLQMLAAGALAVGDGVYLSAADHVNKGLTANIAAAVGIVVGGKGTRGRCYPEAKIGDVAAAGAEDWVLVCIEGKCRAVADAAIAAGAAVTFGGTTSGRLDDPTTDATVVVGSRIGKALNAAGSAGVEFDVLVNLF